MSSGDAARRYGNAHASIRKKSIDPQADEAVKVFKGIEVGQETQSLETEEEGRQAAWGGGEG